MPGPLQLFLLGLALAVASCRAENKPSSTAEGTSRLGQERTSPSLLARATTGQGIAPVPQDRGYAYIHDNVSRMPWSIHLMKISRRHPNLEIDTAMGHGTAFGVAIVSQQMQLIPRDAGRPLAAINGDMFQSHYLYGGDPDGLQIVHGELVSAPHPTRVCFWQDAQGDFHRSNVLSSFAVVWPNGATTPIGLNEERDSDMAVLFTPVVGPRTRTRGGCDFVLGGPTNSPFTRLEIGKTYRLVVKAVTPGGNAPILRQSVVLSVGQALLAQVPKITNGAVLTISTATVPNLAGARTAIGGGPTLVSGGKPWHWPGFFQLRHPRSAIGWNKDYFFMVEVDGRQAASVGMSFAELADYLIRLGCQEAMNLDGGGSATLWVDGRVVNSPSQGYERPSANSVVLMERPKK